MARSRGLVIASLILALVHTTSAHEVSDAIIPETEFAHPEPWLRLDDEALKPKKEVVQAPDAGEHEENPQPMEDQSLAMISENMNATEAVAASPTLRDCGDANFPNRCHDYNGKCSRYRFSKCLGGNIDNGHSEHTILADKFYLRGPNGKWCRTAHNGNGYGIKCDQHNPDGRFESREVCSGGWLRHAIKPTSRDRWLTDPGFSHRVENNAQNLGGWEAFETIDVRVTLNHRNDFDYWEYGIAMKGGRTGHKCQLDGDWMRCNGGTSSAGWTNSQFIFTVVYYYDYINWKATSYQTNVDTAQRWTIRQAKHVRRCPDVPTACALPGNCLSGSASTIEWFFNRGETCQNAWSKGIDGNAGESSVHKRCPDWAGTGTGAWDNAHYKACRDQIMAQRGGQCNPQGVEVEGINRQGESNGNGMYFTFSEPDWEDEFGSFHFNQAKTIKQCRGSQTVRTGEVKVWDNSQCRRRTCKGVHGRYNQQPISAGDWQPHDYIVTDNSRCI